MKSPIPILFLSYLMPAVAAPETKFPLAFSFGESPVKDKFTHVGPTTDFTPTRGFGFESDRDHTGDPAAARLFSVVLAEGNYDVTLTLGDANAGTNTTVKAESRRLMLEQVVTKPGEFIQRHITVNIRTPLIPGGDCVRIKEREKTMLHWDDKLTLEFNGSRPGVASLEIQPTPDPLTVFLLGDSTVADQPLEPWNSWGQMLPRFFKRGVAVANYAETGESLKSSLAAMRVAKVLSTAKRGDYVMIQFGHNDQKDNSPTALEAYEANLRTLIADVKAKGATPVLITSMERKNGRNGNTLAGYPDVARRISTEKTVPLIDLQKASITLYQSLEADLDKAFQDSTHHNNYGSYELAKCVAQGIRESGQPLASLLTEDFHGFDPRKPDPIAEFGVPASPIRSDVKPDGN